MVEKNLDATREQAWRALLKGHALLVARLDADLQHEAGMSLTSYDVLVQLSEAPDRRLPMAELARAVVYSRSGLTRLVDALERRGWVVRERSSTDRRSWFTVITDDGLAALERAWPVHIAGVREHFAAHADPDQARALGAVFGAVIADLAPDVEELRHFHPQRSEEPKT
ncbi:MarR family winged helix-turn-helix transcriptional regulator [Streptomyces zaomyceticus]|uniref:MarR family winged helix-turn-helix transcriptional regulator n=1 Tax=Streptomyces zaomyceticus TaxID=68286 RepID=UPI001673C58B|nr:MarR family transcriptional regulator [Streptomyces zaomyceticus]GHG36965.1 MarR family transcriptional regulator [Streptomyces zaomyceticus]